MTRNNTFTTLLEDERILLRGLRSRTIKEAPVSVVLNGEAVPPLHAIELYRKIDGGRTTPLFVSDIVANLFFRQTCQFDAKRSATFGSSAVGTVSFRAKDGALSYIPTIDAVTAKVGDTLEITTAAHFGEDLRILSRRSYPVKGGQSRDSMQLTIEFHALRDVEICYPMWRTDAFRFLTLSSMFASEKCFDANLIEVEDLDGTVHQFGVTDQTQREAYIVPSRLIGVKALRLTKNAESGGARGTPGAFDAPSLEVKILPDSWVPDLTVQGFLSGSTSIDDDSLSVWLEWSQAPRVIQAGTDMSISFEVSAYR